MDGSTSCGYTHTYNDVRTGIARDYRCPRPRHDGGHSCLFHTATGTDPEEIRKAFMAELESEPGQGECEPLLFIGCRMPAIEIEDLSTERTVYFTNAKFEGDVELSNVTCEAIDFTDAEFAGQLGMVATPPRSCASEKLISTLCTAILRTTATGLLLILTGASLSPTTWHLYLRRLSASRAVTLQMAAAWIQHCRSIHTWVYICQLCRLLLLQARPVAV